VIFDSVGNALRLSRRGFARWLGRQARRRNPVDYAVRQLGFVRVEMTGSPVVVDLEPTTANHLAVIAAFYEIADYEIAGRAPTRVLLMYRGEPDRFEVFCRFGPVFRRIEELTKRLPDGSQPRRLAPAAFGAPEEAPGT
jgi:hypothetical protein